MLARAFGVETEFAHDANPSVVVEALENQGLDAQREEYNHAVRNHWKVTTDSSCGFELVSPILLEQNYRSITGAMRAVSDAGGYITDSCGLHVHVELPENNRTSSQALRVARFYHEVFPFIAPMLSPARREGSNSFCRMDTADVDNFLEQVSDGRYTAVNIQCLNRQPTIEFRQLQGTLSAPLAISWMTVCDAIVVHALDPERASLDAFRRHLRYNTTQDVADVLIGRGVEI